MQRFNELLRIVNRSRNVALGVGGCALLVADQKVTLETPFLVRVEYSSKSPFSAFESSMITSIKKKRHGNSINVRTCSYLET